MTRHVCVCSPRDTIHTCAAAMARNDIGALPVVEGNVLVGMVTDRDIALRAIATGKGPDTPVAEVVTPEVLYCFEDQELEHVARSMGAARVRRVPVLTRDKRLTGVFSLGDVAQREPEVAGEAVAGVSQRGGPHSQKLEAAA